MLSSKPCECEDKTRCGGFLTRTEIKMNELDGSRSAQEYHEILDLFDAAYDAFEEDLYGSPK